MTNPQDGQAADKFVGGNALDLVVYQIGSVVSRTIVKEKTGTVTVFVHVLDGEAEITIGGQASRLVKDDLILMPANVPHAVKAVERFKMMLVMIRDAAK
jgi:mannose-6-phosphate isomerase-like protein (cupin superfamily)